MPNDKPEQPKADTSPADPSTKEEDTLDTPEVQADASAAPADQQTQTATNEKPAKNNIIKRFSLFNNLYLLIFVLLVLVAGAVVYISMQASKKQTNTTKLTSLTDEQLSSLKGNTTLVGDAKQTLDIQSNTIFEGQVLARSDLNVAGTIKVGGTLSLPSIAVGDTGTFGQLGINKGLNVGGDTTLQGQLTIQKNLQVTGSASFGSLSVSSLSVTSLQLRGDLSIKRHIVTSGGNPGRTKGTALGSGGTASVSGSDIAGTVSISTGSGPATGCFLTVSFSQSFSSAPHVVISPSNSSAANLKYYTNRSSSGFSVCTVSAPAPGTNYSYDYVVIH
jgi:cell division protein FtsL